MPLCFYIYVHALILLAVIDHLTSALTLVSQKSDGISYSLKFNLANIYWVISLFKVLWNCLFYEYHRKEEKNLRASTSFRQILNSWWLKLISDWVKKVTLSITLKQWILVWLDTFFKFFIQANLLLKTCIYNTGEYYILNICDKKDYSARYGEIICRDIEQGVE